MKFDKVLFNFLFNRQRKTYLKVKMIKNKLIFQFKKIGLLKLNLANIFPKY